MLDAYGLLRQSSHGEIYIRLNVNIEFKVVNYDQYMFSESRKKRERNLEEDDFYESDEDNFLDRTGTS